MKTARDSNGRIMLVTVKVGNLTLNVWHRRYGSRIGLVFGNHGRLASVAISREDAKRLIARA